MDGVDGGHESPITPVIPPPTVGKAPAEPSTTPARPGFFTELGQVASSKGEQRRHAIGEKIPQVISSIKEKLVKAADITLGLPEAVKYLGVEGTRRTWEGMINTKDRLVEKVNNAQDWLGARFEKIKTTALLKLSNVTTKAAIIGLTGVVAPTEAVIRKIVELPSGLYEANQGLNTRYADMTERMRAGTPIQYEHLIRDNPQYADAIRLEMQQKIDANNVASEKIRATADVWKSKKDECHKRADKFRSAQRKLAELKGTNIPQVAVTSTPAAESPTVAPAPVLPDIPPVVDQSVTT